MLPEITSARPKYFNSDFGQLYVQNRQKPKLTLDHRVSPVIEANLKSPREVLAERAAEVKRSYRVVDRKDPFSARHQSVAYDSSGAH